jgi:hypothetical protein
MTQNRSVFQPIKHLFSHALSIYTVYVFNFENVVISYVSYGRGNHGPVQMGLLTHLHTYDTYEITTFSKLNTYTV